MQLFDRRTEDVNAYWARSERDRLAKAAAAPPTPRDPKIAALIAAIHAMSPDLSVADVETLATEIFRNAAERARVTRVGQQRERASELLSSHAQAQHQAGAGLGKGQRIELRKVAADPGALTKRQLAHERLMAIAKERHPQVEPATAYAQLIARPDTEVRKILDLMVAPDAHLTTVEIAKATAEQVAETRKAAVRAARGEPADLNDAAQRIVQSGGVPYDVALSRAAIAYPALYDEWRGR